MKKRIVCEHCGKKFEYKKGINNRYKYCSVTCSHAADKENLRKFMRRAGVKIDAPRGKYLKTKSGLEVRNDILGQTMCRGDIMLREST